MYHPGWSEYTDHSTTILQKNPSSNFFCPALRLSITKYTQASGALYCPHALFLVINYYVAHFKIMGWLLGSRMALASSCLLLYGQG